MDCGDRIDGDIEHISLEGEEGQKKDMPEAGLELASSPYNGDVLDQTTKTTKRPNH
jgi:hypothetical protein